MNRDFKINGNEIGSNNIWYDLHNRFNFMGFSWEPIQERLCLAFAPIEKWKIESDEKLIFVFENVDFLKICSIEKNKCFEEAGYKYPTDFGYEWFLTEEERDSSDHLIFWFEDGGYIRVHARKRRLNTQKEFESSDALKYIQFVFEEVPKILPGDASSQ